MRYVFFSLLLFVPGGAQALMNSYCHSPIDCHPHGLPYGHDVVLAPGGEWIDRDGARTWANIGTRNARVISQANSDERNGELAYQTAYDSFMDGKYNGGNKVEHLGGRWDTKITTPDGIVLFKDAANNVAVQSPDGKWHVTNSRGEYASTTLELETKAAPARMVAKGKKAAKKGVVAKGKKAAKGAVAQAKKKSDGGRKLASVEPAVEAAPEGAAEAKAAAESASAEAAAALASLAGGKGPAPAAADKAEAKPADKAEAKPAEKAEAKAEAKVEAKAAEAKPAEAAKGTDAKAVDPLAALTPIEALSKNAAPARAPASAAAETKAPAAAAPAAAAPLATTAPATK